MLPRSHPRTIGSRLTGGALAAVLCLAAAACSSTSSSPAAGSPASSTPGSNPLAGGATAGTVVVGSANFPEDELVAEIYIQALQAKGIKATPKLNIGAREIYYPPIRNGAITIIPEYNGALLGNSVDPSSTAKTTVQVDAALKAKLPSTLEILAPAPAQDKDSVTVTQATATKDHLTSIGDLKPYAKNMIVGGPSQLQTRPYGLPGLKNDYGLQFKGFDPLDESGPITLVPLVYKPAMSAGIIAVLNAISAKLTTALLLQMDNAIITQHADYATVAAGFLKAEGLS